MGLRTRFKTGLNRCLGLLNMRLESLNAQRTEMSRLQELVAAGHFGRPVFPVLEQFVSCNPTPMLEAVDRFKPQTSRFADANGEDRYSFSNDYFSSPDAEVAYMMVREIRPRHIMEIGSGYSTSLFREAIRDGQLETELVSIDPQPRRAVAGIADRVIRQRLEHVRPGYLAETLGHNDILFIDSSHEIRIGNDVVDLLLNVIPALRSGVVIHLHDIFLPYDYPREWIVENGWAWDEQYLVQALLQDSDRLKVLWPGFYFQQTLPDFGLHFHDSGGRASSLWLRRTE